MNIKALALSATLALGSIFGSVAPAEAGTCWALRNGNGRGEWCQVERRVNANGHKVIDVKQGANEMTLVLWENGTVEVLHDSVPYNERWAHWYIDREGDLRVTLGGPNELAFRF